MSGAHHQYGVRTGRVNAKKQKFWPQGTKKIQNTGNVDINIKVKKNGSLLTFKLKNKREINRKGVNLLKNIDILSDIN